jgi:hypothetical protein
MSEKTAPCFFEKAIGALTLADQCGCKFAAKCHAFFLFTIWVGPFEVAQMGQK